MHRRLRNTTHLVALASALAFPVSALAQDDAASVLTNPALSDLDAQCAATIALLEETPGTNIAKLPEDAVAALEPGAAECVRTVQAKLKDAGTGEAPTTEAAAPEAEQNATPGAEAQAEADATAQTENGAADSAEAATPEAMDALPGTEAEQGAAPEATAQAEPQPEAAPETQAPEATAESAPQPEVIPEEQAPETTAEATPESEAAPETQAPEATADAATEQEAAPEVQPAPEATAETAPEPEAVPVPEAGSTDTAADAEAAPEQPAQGETANAADAGTTSGDAQLEVAQEDTKLATEAANQQVTTAAAASADAGTDAVPSDAEVTTEVVTEQNSRSSSEEFASKTAAATATAPQTQTQTGNAQAKNDDKMSDLAKIAAGVIGGLVLNDILKPDEKVVENTGDRVVVQRPNGEYFVMKDDNALMRQPGVELKTQTFSDGSTRQIATRDDGTTIETIRAANGQVLRRAKYLPDGTEVLLFDDTAQFDPVDVSKLPQPIERRDFVDTSSMDEQSLRAALAAKEAPRYDRRFSLAQIRNIRAVRNLVPIIELESVTFDTGSAAIRPSEAEELSAIGNAMREMIDRNPDEVFLIEGHTDAVGSASMNLALSDRRAESVALALTEYFDVPPENMVVQGYGESNLKVPTALAERQNRRAAVRRITPLLQTAQAN